MPIAIPRCGSGFKLIDTTGGSATQYGQSSISLAWARTDNFSISLTYKVGSSDFYLFSKLQDTGESGRRGIWAYGGKTFLRVEIWALPDGTRAEINFTFPYSIPAGRIVNIIITKSSGHTASTVNAYLDGVSLTRTIVTDILTSSSDITSTNPLRINYFQMGNSYTRSYLVFSVVYYDVKIYNVVISSASRNTIVRTYGRQIPEYSSLVESWGFQHTSGSTASGEKGNNLSLIAIGTPALVTSGASSQWNDWKGEQAV